ncbi:MAG TPA: efflux transporter periplasmic adaptor subunit, partial [Polyangia bacterium]
VDEQRVNVVVAFADPPGAWAALGDGFRVEARLVLWQGENVVKVPLGAVFRQGDGWAVYRIEDEVARLTRIEIGHRGEAEVEITKGLAPNTLVAVHPGDRIKEGVRVDVRD